MPFWAGPRYRNRQRTSAAKGHSPPRSGLNLSSRHQSIRRQVESSEAAVEPPALLQRRDERTQSLEAILFLAREPLNARKLAQYANLADGTEALTLIRQLNRLYGEENRAFRVESVSGGYQLMTHPALADWLRRLASAPVEVRLSTPAMETLAVVAYRQPVQRADVEAIRGVACGEMLRQLMERELVRIEGRSEELGRPFLYGTTNRFLHVFGLGSIEDLPRAEMLREPTLLLKESETVSVSIGEVKDLAPGQLEDPGRFDEDAPAIAVADMDDDEYDDDDLDDEDDDFDDEEFDDDFDDEYDDDDEWDEDELEDDELVDDEEEDEDEWEEVEDDDEYDDEEEEDEDDEEEWDEEEDED